jgi:hypothetical protein
MAKTRELSRKCVLQILRDAFNRCVDYDYAWGHILHEEGLRASVYGYTRTILDMAPDWRVFCGISCSETKPDLIFFRSSDDHKKHEAIEILVEIKHWPTERQIKSDIEKLIQLGKRVSPHCPTLVFLAILGNKNENFRKAAVPQLKQRYKKLYPKVQIWFRSHDGFYCGPWDEEAKFDPWRNCLKKLKKN